MEYDVMAHRWPSSHRARRSDGVPAAAAARSNCRRGVGEALSSATRRPETLEDLDRIG